MNTESEEILEDVKKGIVKELTKESKIKNENNDASFYDEDLLRGQKEEIKLQILITQWQSLEDDRKARKIYAAFTFIYVGLYIIVVLGIFYHYQFYLIPHTTKFISNTPINFLLSSMTANVIAALIVVMNYIFPNPRK